MKDKNNYRKIKKSEIFVDYSELERRKNQINKENWTMGWIIDYLIKNKIILIKKER